MNRLNQPLEFSEGELLLLDLLVLGKVYKQISWTHQINDTCKDWCFKQDGL